MLSCKDVTHLASRSLDTELPLPTRVGMRLHLAVCRVCSRYVKHLRFLHDAAAQWDNHDSGDERMPEACRERILAVLEQERDAT